MSDDLDVFFAKKKAKQAGRKKKPGVQDINVLAQKLEKAVRTQEEVDKEEEEYRNSLKLAEGEAQHAANDDPDWIQYSEPDGNVDLNGLQIKELELDPNTNMCESDDDAQEVKKTWGKMPDTNLDAEVAVPDETADEKVPPGVDVVEGEDEDEMKTVTATKYVPPSRRHMGHPPGGSWGVVGGGASKARPDIEDSSQFPSLGDASRLEKEAEHHKKMHEAAKIRAVQAARGVQSEEHGSLPAPEPLKEQPEEPLQHVHSKNAYIPPSLRKKLDGGPKPMEMSNRFGTLEGGRD